MKQFPAIDRALEGRVALPDWPRLMAADLAAAYLGIGETTLRETGPKPKALGRRRLYDRRDLDRFADALDGQELEGRDADDQAKDVERKFLESRKKRGNP